MSQGGYGSRPSGPSSGTPSGSDPFAGAAPWPGPPSVSPQPRQDANKLATLSVVFAFVFAPAGAILGHLGLAQLRRSGQRGRDRALVGLTLSYVFITVAVVALVIWAVAGGEPSGSSTAGTSAAPAPTTTTAPPPPPPPPPTVDAAGMPGLLLSLDEIRAFTGDPNMVSDKTYTDVELPSPDEGSFEPVACLGSFAGGVPGPYERTNYRKYLATTQVDFQTGLQVGQSVAIFDTAADAQKALANYVEYWRRCANTQGVFSVPGQGQMNVHLGAPVDAGGGITSLVNTADGSPAKFTRAIAAKANVLVDNHVGGLDVTDQNVALTQRILERIPR
jgi:eukaryotic-like serine/threonine-protein kinase